MGSKIRKIASIEKGLEDVLQALTEDEIKNAIGKTKDYVAKCSDPEPADEIIRNIDHYQSVALDKACVAKGISPPMLTAHQFMIDQEKSKHQSDLGDMNRLLVRFTILDGDLKKVIEDAQDPEGPGKEKITALEKKKIFTSIKAIEDKILKIKLSIDKK